MSVTGNVVVQVALDESTDLDLATSTIKHRDPQNLALTSGTGANQVNAVFSDERTLTATSETLDLYGGLTNALGTTLNFAKIKVLYIKNTHASSNLLVGNASAPVLLCSAANDIIIVPPGGVLLITAPASGGITVTNSSADGIKIDSGAATITYNIIIAGVV